MSGPLQAGNFGYRRKPTSGASGDRGAAVGSHGLVGGTSDSGDTTKKAARHKPGGVRGTALRWSVLDVVPAHFASHLADYVQAVLLDQTSARAEHGACSVLLPFHRGHDLLQRRSLR